MAGVTGGGWLVAGDGGLAIFPVPGTAAYRNARQQAIMAAEGANEPGRFTAFTGYEWTSNAGGNDLHNSTDDHGAWLHLPDLVHSELMRRWLVVAAVSEALTGLALLVSPSLGVRLLFGSTIDGAGVGMGRVCGISLVALGIACWPAADGTRDRSQAYGGMVTYVVLAGAYLAGLGVTGKAMGRLLWPAVAAHAILAAGLALAWSRRPAPLR